MMHANIDELLQIKEGHDIAISSHVTGCSYCQQALIELKHTQDQLQNLTATVPQGAWENIQREYEDMNKSQHSLKLTRAIYTLVATVLITGAGVVFTLSQYPALENQKQHSMMQLIADSNALENMIAVQLSISDGALSHQASFTMDKIKWRLMLIDQKIQSLPNNDTDKKISLWQDRVRALKAINSSYYQLINNNINQQPL